MSDTNRISLQDALQAQKALRDAAGLGTETFPVEEFVGMVSDEIEQLRKLGHTDEQIAAIIRGNSPVAVTAKQIQENYATPEERHAHHQG